MGLPTPARTLGERTSAVCIMSRAASTAFGVEPSRSCRHNRVMARTATEGIHPALRHFHPPLRHWFCQMFDGPTAAQAEAWPALPADATPCSWPRPGSGKTLAAFLVAIDRIMFDPAAREAARGVRVLYVTPLKALGVDIERNLRAPLAGVRAIAEREGTPYHLPRVGVRSGDTPPRDRHQLRREPPDILITTPESLYLMLTSRAREILLPVDTLIVDEIHSLVANKRGAHLFVSLGTIGDVASRGPAVAAAAATHRVVGDAAAAGGNRSAVGRRRSDLQPRGATASEAGGDRGGRPRKAARSADRGAGRGHGAAGGAAWRSRVPPRPGRRCRPSGRPSIRGWSS